MKKFLPIIVIVFLVLIIISGAVIIYYSTLQKQISVPIFGSTPSQNLSTAIQNSTLHLDSAPFVANDMLQASVSGYSVLFSLNKDLNPQVRALQLVLPAVKMDNKTVREIDLRFEKVIIRY